MNNYMIVDGNMETGINFKVLLSFKFKVVLDSFKFLSLKYLLYKFFEGGALVVSHLSNKLKQTQIVIRRK